MPVVERVNLGETHEYRLGEKRLLGVSEALSLAGIIQLGHIPTDVLGRAAERGSDVHLACEDLDRGKVDWWTGTEAEPYVRAYVKWKKDSMFHVEQIEEVVSDSIHGYAGTLDRAGMISTGKKHPEPAVIDIKTTVAMYPWAPLQLAAYNCTFPDAHVRRRIAVQLKRDGSYRVHVFDNNVEDTQTWFAALRIAKWKVKNGLT